MIIGRFDQLGLCSIAEASPFRPDLADIKGDSRPVRSRQPVLAEVWHISGPLALREAFQESEGRATPLARPTPSNILNYRKAGPFINESALFFPRVGSFNATLAGKGDTGRPPPGRTRPPP